MLDVLHLPDPTVFRGAGAWDGCRRILEGGINAENALGEVRFIDPSSRGGFTRSRVVLIQTFILS